MIASRDAYRGLSAPEALRSARRQSRGPLGDAVWRPVPLRRGERVRSYVGPHHARLDRPGRVADAIVSSTFPLRTRDGRGWLRPVDLRLRRRNGAVRPVNPLVRTTLPAELGRGARLNSTGLVVTPVRIRGRARAIIARGRAFFPNAARDTDWVFEPLPEGVQTFAILRSPASPQRHGLRFAAGAAARVRRSNHPLGGFEIVRHGSVLARFATPQAWDADGRAVKVRANLLGPTLRMDVAHRRPDVRYPVTVDPPVVEDFKHWKDNAGLDFTGWRSATNDAAKYKFTAGSAYLGRGLYVYTRSSFTYSPADSGQWLFDARGYGDAYIQQAEFHRLHHDNYHVATALFTGIFDPAAGTGVNRSSDGRGWQGNSPISTTPNFYDSVANARPNLHCVEWPACPQRGARGNIAVFGNRPQATGLSSNFTDFMGGAAIVQADDVKPFRSADTVPAGWVRTASPTITFTDTGLGMRTAAVAIQPRRAWSHTIAQPASATKVQEACADTDPDLARDNMGTRNNPCPRDLAVGFGSGDLPDGIHTLEATGTDVLGDVVTDTSRSLKLDTAGPTLKLEGPVSRERYVAPGALLRIIATDGASASPTTARSGAKRIDVIVDGVVQPGDPDRACPAGSCELTRDFRVGPQEGERTIQVRAFDHVDNARELPEPLRVVVDDVAPVPVSTERPRIVEPANATAVGEELEATDGQWSNLESGHTFEYRWQSCADDGAACENILGATSKRYRTTPGQLDRRLRVVVTAVNRPSEGQSPGRASATSDPSRKITPDLIDPILLEPEHLDSQGAPAPPPVEWVDDHHAKVKGTATDVGLGLHRMDLTEPLDPSDKIRSQRFRTLLGDKDCDGTATAMCPPAGWQTFTYNTAPFRQGYVHPGLEAVDAAGRRSVKKLWTLKVDHTPPVITPSGSLNGFVGGAITAAGTYPLTVAVTDGVRGGTPAQQRAGVDSVELLVSTDEGAFVSRGVKRFDECAGDSCTGADAYTASTSELGEGLHAVKVIAKDRLYDRVPDALKSKHISTTVLRFFVDLEPPAIDSVTHEPAIPEWVGAHQLGFSVTGRDASTGVKEFRLTTPTANGDVEQAASMGCSLSTTAPSRCPQDNATRALSYSASELPEGRAVKLRVRAIDAVARDSVSHEWALQVDHGAPAAPVTFSIGATYDALTGNTFVDWDPIPDPPLADGTDASGTAAYTYRYRRNAGAWSAPAETAGQSATLPMGFTGEALEFEVTPRDAAGNTGAAASASTVVVLAGDSCRGTSEGVDPTCIPDDQEEAEADNETPAELEPADSSARNNADLFKINVVKGEWATVRRQYRSFAIGNVKEPQLYKRIDRNYDTTLGYTTGFVYGDFNSCGWVKSNKVISLDRPATTNCSPNFFLPAHTFMVAANCLKKNKADTRCDDGTNIEVERTVEACYNITPNFPSVPTKCEGPSRTIHKGQQVFWRYVTKGRKYTNFVMVRIAGVDHGDAPWMFLPRRALQEHLCGVRYGCAGMPN